MLYWKHLETVRDAFIDINYYYLLFFMLNLTILAYLIYLLDNLMHPHIFCTAKTVRNDNSSRFGKYIRLQYTHRDTLVSAFTETFLLEKSRLTSVDSENERNYHIFYEMFAGSDESLDLTRLGLECGVRNFQILFSPTSTAPSYMDDDCENFSLLCASLRILGASEEEMQEIWHFLATVLHLGNCNVSSNVSSSGDLQVDVSCTTRSMDQLADSLGLKAEGFSQALTVHVVQLGRRGSITRKRLSPDDVAHNIQALMKWMYSNLFKWLLRKINYVHCGRPGELPVSSDRAVKFIGILDIFGYE